MLSPAKINWTLQILGRRGDGFHELRSWFLALNWGDELQFQSNESLACSSLTIHGPRAEGVPTDARNLLCQAEQLWREAGGVAPFGAWDLRKNIPAGAGLGGGSSNAAIALHLLQSVATQPLPAAECRRIAQHIGSDVDFFWQRQSAELRGGRGEAVLASAAAPAIHLVLALSDFHAATAAVYRELHADPIAECDAIDPQWPPEPGINELQAAACRCLPGLAELGNRLNQHAAFTMSGSGSSYFAVCTDQAEAEGLALQIKPLVRQVVLCQPL